MSAKWNLARQTLDAWLGCAFPSRDRGQSQEQEFYSTESKLANLATKAAPMGWVPHKENDCLPTSSHRRCAYVNSKPRDF